MSRHHRGNAGIAKGAEWEQATPKRHEAGRLALLEVR